MTEDKKPARKFRVKLKRPPPLKQTRAEIRSLKPDVWKLLKRGTELELMRFLRGIGIKDEDPRFAIAVKTYRDLKSGKL
jgi:hypothetical protein